MAWDHTRVIARPLPACTAHHQILFDTWRTSSHAAIRRNCALVIANLYGDCDPARPWAPAAVAAVAMAAQQQAQADSRPTEAAGAVAMAGGAEPSDAEAALDMPHDDLTLPVLGLCAPDASQAELLVCASSLVRRR